MLSIPFRASLRASLPARRSAVSAAVAATLALTIATAPVGAKPARADDPIYLGWTALLPPLLDQYTPSQAAECGNGDPSCVNATIARMTDQFNQLTSTCDHRALFSLAYLRTTQKYQDVAAEPGYFDDPAYVNTEDAVFAAYYFRAYDDWTAGNISALPTAWQIAFSAATGKKVSGVGDFLLGMNAHINRDLPFVLASLGLVTPGGASRKPDHDQVNVFLNQVINPLLQEAAARFDPSVTDLSTPYGITWTAFMQIIEAWRQAAWTNAELLVDAPTAAARAVVARTIETTAATEATTLRTTYSYVPLVMTTGPRDAYCQAHHG
ncbi:MAG: DUF5995 family protein [Frankia sp.]